MQKLTTEIMERYPFVTIEPLKSGAEKVLFPPSTNADYRFLVYTEEEPQIYAALLENPDSYFWYYPFEVVDFNNNPESMFATLHRTLEHLIFKETRVTQTRGLLTWSFTLEYKEGLEWRKVYGHDCTKGAFPVPHIDGKQKIYLSGPVA